MQQANSGPFPTEALRPVFSEIISACLSLEHPLRVAFLGPEATFTHMAARSRFGLSARYVPAATVAGVFTEVEGVADLGVVPIENSTEGVVNSTLDVLIDSELCITAEIATDGEPLPAHALGDARRRTEGLLAPAGAGAVPGVAVAESAQRGADRGGVDGVGGAALER